MNGITPPSVVSIEIPQKSYTCDELVAECEAIGLHPSPPNLRRICRALNLFNADAVHLISDGNHKIYAVQSQSNSNQFYTVQGASMSTLTCECPDTFNGFECKHVFAVRLFDEQRRDQAMIDNYEECEANRGCAIDYAEGNRAAHLAESGATYQTAKSRFEDLPLGQRPDALTRRNGMLITKKICPRWDKRILAEMLTAQIIELFPEAEIHKVTIDNWYIGRVYFSLP